MNPVDPQAAVETANNDNAGLIVDGNADVGNWNKNENRINNEPKFDIRIEAQKSDFALQQLLQKNDRLRTKFEEAEKRYKDLETNEERKRAALEKQSEALEAEVKNKRRALLRRKDEVSTLSGKLSDEVSRREKSEAETQRVRQELEASIKQKHHEFLDMQGQHEKTIAVQKEEISSLGFKLTDEVRNMTEYREKIELEQQELKAAVEKERCAYLDMQKENENSVAKHTDVISRLSAKLSEESSLRIASEAEAQRVRQELEAAVEKERNSFLELQKQKEEISTLNSKLSEEIRRRKEFEAGSQQERQRLQVLFDEKCRELIRTQEHYDNAVAAVKKAVEQRAKNLYLVL